MRLPFRTEAARAAPLNQEALAVLRGGAKGPSFLPPRRSLLGEILDWMLAPLFLLWPMSVAITYVVALNIANVPYDRALAGTLRVLAEQVHAGAAAASRLDDTARTVLSAHGVDQAMWLALGSQGEYLGGDHELPFPKEARPAAPGRVLFADDTRAASPCGWRIPGSTPRRRCERRRHPRPAQRWLSWPRPPKPARSWPTTSSRA